MISILIDISAVIVQRILEGNKSLCNAEKYAAGWKKYAAGWESPVANTLSYAEASGYLNIMVPFVE